MSTAEIIISLNIQCFLLAKKQLFVIRCHIRIIAVQPGPDWHSFRRTKWWGIRKKTHVKLG